MQVWTGKSRKNKVVSCRGQSQCLIGGVVTDPLNCHEGQPETLCEKLNFWKGIFTYWLQNRFFFFLFSCFLVFLPISRQVKAQHCGLISWKNNTAFVSTLLIQSELQWRSVQWGNSWTLQIKTQLVGEKSWRAGIKKTCDASLHLQETR